jgi:hypothetical protein
MSYTLRGRLESRLAATMPVVLLACLLALAAASWWPVAVVALMLAAGLALDVVVYHPALPYQPGWLAAPMGLVELVATMALVRALGVDAPLGRALLLFAGAWLIAQVLAHAGFPLAFLSYGEDGGELGRAGVAAGLAVALVLAGAGGVAWATRPPTVHLAAGVHRGPLVLDHAQTLVGEPGAVVRGGIIVRADDVTVRDVTVVGGENGIAVHDAERVVLDGVTVTGATMDGIHARRAQVAVRDCRVDMRGAYTQAIDLSFGMDLGMSSVSGCVVHGGQEGIVSHMMKIDVRENRVTGTHMRGIAIVEMSMGMVRENEVAGVLGAGIFCGDYSMCGIERNTVYGTRAADGATDAMRGGFAIVSHFGSTAEVHENVLHGNAGGITADADAKIERRAG